MVNLVLIIYQNAKLCFWPVKGKQGILTLIHIQKEAQLEVRLEPVILLLWNIFRYISHFLYGNITIVLNVTVKASIYLINIFLKLFLSSSPCFQEI